MSIFLSITDHRKIYHLFLEIDQHFTIALLESTIQPISMHVGRTAIIHLQVVIPEVVLEIDIEMVYIQQQ